MLEHFFNQQHRLFTATQVPIGMQCARDIFTQSRQYISPLLQNQNYQALGYYRDRGINYLQNSYIQHSTATEHPIFAATTLRSSDSDRKQVSFNTKTNIIEFDKSSEPMKPPLFTEDGNINRVRFNTKNQYIGYDKTALVTEQPLFKANGRSSSKGNRKRTVISKRRYYVREDTGMSLKTIRRIFDHKGEFDTKISSDDILGSSDMFTYGISILNGALTGGAAGAIMGTNTWYEWGAGLAQTTANPRRDISDNDPFNEISSDVLSKVAGWTAALAGGIVGFGTGALNGAIDASKDYRSPQKIRAELLLDKPLGKW